MGCSFALLQEPCASGSKLKSMPVNMRIFFDTSSHSAVILNDVNVDAPLVCASSHGVYVPGTGWLP